MLHSTNQTAQGTGGAGATLIDPSSCHMESSRLPQALFQDLFPSLPLLAYFPTFCKGAGMLALETFGEQEGLFPSLALITPSNNTPKHPASCKLPLLDRGLAAPPV